MRDVPQPRARGVLGSRDGGGEPAVRLRGPVLLRRQPLRRYRDPLQPARADDPGPELQQAVHLRSGRHRVEPGAQLEHGRAVRPGGALHQALLLDGAGDRGRALQHGRLDHAAQQLRDRQQLRGVREHERRALPDQRVQEGGARGRAGLRVDLLPGDPHRLRPGESRLAELPPGGEGRHHLPAARCAPRQREVRVVQDLHLRGGPVRADGHPGLPRRHQRVQLDAEPLDLLRPLHRGVRPAAQHRAALPPRAARGGSAREVGDLRVLPELRHGRRGWRAGAVRQVPVPGAGRQRQHARPHPEPDPRRAGDGRGRHPDAHLLERAELGRRLGLQPERQERPGHLQGLAGLVPRPSSGLLLQPDHGGDPAPLPVRGVRLPAHAHAGEPGGHRAVDERSPAAGGPQPDHVDEGHALVSLRLRAGGRERSDRARRGVRWRHDHRHALREGRPRQVQGPAGPRAGLRAGRGPGHGRGGAAGGGGRAVRARLPLHAGRGRGGGDHLAGLRRRGGGGGRGGRARGHLRAEAARDGERRVAAGGAGDGARGGVRAAPRRSGGLFGGEREPDRDPGGRGARLRGHVRAGDGGVGGPAGHGADRGRWALRGVRAVGGRRRRLRDGRLRGGARRRHGADGAGRRRDRPAGAREPARAGGERAGARGHRRGVLLQPVRLRGHQGPPLLRHRREHLQQDGLPERGPGVRADHGPHLRGDHAPHPAGADRQGGRGLGALHVPADGRHDLGLRLQRPRPAGHQQQHELAGAGAAVEQLRDGDGRGLRARVVRVDQERPGVVVRQQRPRQPEQPPPGPQPQLHQLAAAAPVADLPLLHGGAPAAGGRPVVDDRRHRDAAGHRPPGPLPLPQQHQHQPALRAQVPGPEQLGLLHGRGGRRRRAQLGGDPRQGRQGVRGRLRLPRHARPGQPHQLRLPAAREGARGVRLHVLRRDGDGGAGGRRLRHGVRDRLGGRAVVVGRQREHAAGALLRPELGVAAGARRHGRAPRAADGVRHARRLPDVRHGAGGHEAGGPGGARGEGDPGGVRVQGKPAGGAAGRARHAVVRDGEPARADARGGAGREGRGVAAGQRGGLPDGGREGGGGDAARGARGRGGGGVVGERRVPVRVRHQQQGRGGVRAGGRGGRGGRPLRGDRAPPGGGRAAHHHRLGVQPHPRLLEGAGGGLRRALRRGGPGAGGGAGDAGGGERGRGADARGDRPPKPGLHDGRAAQGLRRHGRGGGGERERAVRGGGGDGGGRHGDGAAGVRPRVGGVPARRGREREVRHAGGARVQHRQLVQLEHGPVVGGRALLRDGRLQRVQRPVVLLHARRGRRLHAHPHAPGAHRQRLLLDRARRVHVGRRAARVQHVERAQRPVHQPVGAAGGRRGGVHRVRRGVPLEGLRQHLHGLEPLLPPGQRLHGRPRAGVREQPVLERDQAHGRVQQQELLRAPVRQLQRGGEGRLVHAGEHQVGGDHARRPGGAAVGLERHHAEGVRDHHGVERGGGHLRAGARARGGGPGQQRRQGDGGLRAGRLPLRDRGEHERDRGARGRVRVHGARRRDPPLHQDADDRLGRARGDLRRRGQRAHAAVQRRRVAADRGRQHHRGAAVPPDAGRLRAGEGGDGHHRPGHGAELRRVDLLHARHHVARLPVRQGALRALRAGRGRAGPVAPLRARGRAGRLRRPVGARGARGGEPGGGGHRARVGDLRGADPREGRRRPRRLPLLPEAGRGDGGPGGAGAHQGVRVLRRLRGSRRDRLRRGRRRRGAGAAGAPGRSVRAAARDAVGRAERARRGERPLLGQRGRHLHGGEGGRVRLRLRGEHLHRRRRLRHPLQRLHAGHPGERGRVVLAARARGVRQPSVGGGGRVLRRRPHHRGGDHAPPEQAVRRVERGVRVVLRARAVRLRGSPHPAPRRR